MKHGVSETSHNEAAETPRLTEDVSVSEVQASLIPRIFPMQLSFFVNKLRTPCYEIVGSSSGRGNLSGPRETRDFLLA